MRCTLTAARKRGVACDVLGARALGRIERRSAIASTWPSSSCVAAVRDGEGPDRYNPLAVDDDRWGIEERIVETEHRVIHEDGRLRRSLRLATQFGKLRVALAVLLGESGAPVELNASSASRLRSSVTGWHLRRTDHRAWHIAPPPLIAAAIACAQGPAKHARRRASRLVDAVVSRHARAG